MAGKPTAQRARAISELTRTAVATMTDARAALASALSLAKDDYDHNADKLQDLVGAVNLTLSALCIEQSTWNGYARARANVPS